VPSWASVSDTIDEEIRRAVGHGLDEARRYFLTDLNEAPTWFVEEARSIRSRLLRHIFLKHYIAASQHRYLAGFDADIIEGGQDPAQWMRGRFICPSFSIRELVIKDVPSILRPLQGVIPQNWQRLRPNWSLWEAGVFISGAPATVLTDVRYTWSPPENVFTMALSEAREFEPISDVTIATRRWLAACCASAAKTRGILGSFVDSKQFIDVVFPDLDRLSEDCSHAIDALLAERRTFGFSDGKVPGFRGPDSWFDRREAIPIQHP